MGSALADPLPEGRFHNAITPWHVERLEHAIDVMEAELQPLDEFILPGGVPGGRAISTWHARLPPRRAVGRRAVPPAGPGCPAPS